MDIDQIIARYLAGESSQEERKELFLWLSKNKSDKNDFGLLESFWSEEQNEVKQSKDKNWRKLQTVIHEGDDKNENLNKTKNQPWSTIYKVAAAIALLIVAYFGFEQYQIANQQKLSINTEIETIVKRNPSGIKSTLKLSDGTIVKLNSESQISFPSHFSASKREITLTGEAFLEVAHNPKKPFIIKTGSLETKVLGTSFNISAYPNQSIQKVALLEGKVEVTDPHKNLKIALEPGEMAVLEKEGIKKAVFDYETEFAWKDGKLVFKNVNNELLFQKLEKWFGYQFVFEKPISPQTYTSTFIKESLKEVLTIIGETKGFEFEIVKEGKKVIIK